MTSRTTPSMIPPMRKVPFAQQISRHIPIVFLAKSSIFVIDNKKGALMEAITFSPAQVHIFNMVSHITSDKALEQLREQLADFYAKQVDAEMDSLWETGEWNQQKLQSLRGSHFRTPYPQQVQCEAH